jgi:hypothetical protein
MSAITCLTADESSEWLRSHGYIAPYESGFAFHREVKTPLDSGQKCALAKCILRWLPADGECILLITAWGIWPSSENRELFERVRASLGETRTIVELPGQVLPLENKGVLECLLDVCFYNFWDIVFADARHRWLIRFSHDEYITIDADPAFAPLAEQALNAFQ